VARRRRSERTAHRQTDCRYDAVQTPSQVVHCQARILRRYALLPRTRRLAGNYSKALEGQGFASSCATIVLCSVTMTSHASAFVLPLVVC
jgi:hypothetical protein